jgi:hypothetical protein
LGAAGSATERRRLGEGGLWGGWAQQARRGSKRATSGQRHTTLTRNTAASVGFAAHAAGVGGDVKHRVLAILFASLSRRRRTTHKVQLSRRRPPLGAAWSWVNRQKRASTYIYLSPDNNIRRVRRLRHRGPSPSAVGSQHSLSSETANHESPPVAPVTANAGKSERHDHGAS